MESTGPGKYRILSGVKFHVKCIQNHVWGPLEARVMSTFVKTFIFAKDAFGETYGLKERYKLYRMVFSKYKALEFGSTL